jgi:phosphatidylserine/phosphatidylglycerophosphate/cardiolipin synthase-like enzyme
LKAVLDRAERKVLISSFNYAYPIKGRSEVYNWIAGAARKGVEVTIFLGLRKGTEIPLARQKLKLLSDAGAKLIISPGIHTKTVLVDDSTIIEGSFNWLAAWGGSDGFRESSILLSGDEAAEHVGRAWSEFERIKRYVESRSAMDYEGTLSIKS